MKLHDNEVPAGIETARTLLREQCPEWAELPLTVAGSGTDNTMYRLGTELLVRLPRTPNTAKALAKEQVWLPRLAPHLPLAVPSPVHRGQPSPEFPLVWSVYRWIDGDEVSERSIRDWRQLAVDVAGFVRTLHAVDLMDARREDDLQWYRGGLLTDNADWIDGCLKRCRDLEELDLDLDRLQQLWLESLALPDPTDEHVWLHGDLKPSNLLATDGRLSAAIDFGCLSVGFPAAEHAAIWDLPKVARDVYWAASNLDEITWHNSEDPRLVRGADHKSGEDAGLRVERAGDSRSFPRPALAELLCPESPMRRGASLDD